MSGECITRLARETTDLVALQETRVYNRDHCFSKLAIWDMSLQQANNLHADTRHSEMT